MPHSHSRIKKPSVVRSRSPARLITGRRHVCHTAALTARRPGGGTGNSHHKTPRVVRRLGPAFQRVGTRMFHIRSSSKTPSVVGRRTGAGTGGCLPKTPSVLRRPRQGHVCPTATLASRSPAWYAGAAQPGLSPGRGTYATQLLPHQDARAGARVALTTRRLAWYAGSARLFHGWVHVCSISALAARRLAW